MRVRTLAFLGLIATSVAVALPEASGQTREEKVRNDRKKIEAEGFWIYNDLAKGFAEAKKTGKPLLVVLRCIPCEECVKLDDDLVDQDPEIRPLLEQYVCVRQVSTNGLDLSTFQYDTDQSFAVFMLNADGTVYGRFGTRSHRTDWLFDVSLKGMAEALKGGLELHKNYPKNAASLKGKKGPKPEFASPEKYPALKDKFTDKLATDGNIVKSCIHCHQIGDAQREFYRSQGKPIPEKVLFPYPHPKILGLIIDPDTRGQLKEVVEDSIAEKSGFQAGDKIVSINDQPILSIADIQWVLHQTDPTGGKISALIDRNGQEIEIVFSLEKGWRQLGDISWRVTAWGLRRMTTGGLVLKSATEEERESLKVAKDEMALRVDYVGQYDAHAAGKNAGFQKDDFILKFDGKSDLVSESQLFNYAINKKKPGDKVSVVVSRGGKRVQLQLPMQN